MEIKEEKIVDQMKEFTKGIKAMQKEFGAGSLFVLGEDTRTKAEFIPIDSMKLSRIMGGGIPRGTFIEIFGWESSGKTTISSYLVGQAQKAGYVCAYIDSENAFNSDYAKVVGLNPDNLIFSQPDNAEQGLSIVESLVDNIPNLGIIVIDSIATLTPQKEIDGDMGDANMGLQARLLGQAFRKLVRKVKDKKVTVLMTNQVRHKIGVLYGCFQYKTAILMEDGTTEWIGKIVNQKINKRVMSLNKITGEIEAKKIIGYYDNGNAEEFIQFKIEKYGGNGFSQFSCTNNHLIFTPCGEIPASDLDVGDYVLGKVTYGLSESQKELLAGMLLGDSCIKKQNKRYTLNCIHGEEQDDYLMFKYGLFKNICTKEPYVNSAGGLAFDTKSFYEFKEYENLFYSDRKRTITKNFLNLLTEKSIAIWYMDDASLNGSHEKWGNGKVEISVKSYKTESEIELLRDWLSDNGYGFAKIKNKKLFFDSENSYILQSRVAKYIIPSMKYKLCNNLQGVVYEPIVVEHIEPYDRVAPVKILEKYIKPKTKSMRKFDLEIEDNHNYLVDGVVVHNSPDTTPGGNAPKFYSSIRLRIRKAEDIIEKNNLIGIKIHIKAIKNKVATPMREDVMELYFDTGFDVLAEAVDFAVHYGLIKKGGAWFTIDTGEIFQGKSKVVEYYKNNVDDLIKLRDEVLVRMNENRREINENTDTDDKQDID